MNKSWHLRKNSKRPNRAWVHLDVYNHGVYVLWPVNQQQLMAEFLKVAKGCDFKVDDYEIDRGRYLSCNGWDCIGFSSAKPSAGMIAHEALHYVTNLGQSLELEGEEAYAYLLMYVTDRIYELTRNKPCMI